MFADLNLKSRALKDVIEKMYGSPTFCKYMMIKDICINISSLSAALAARPLGNKRVSFLINFFGCKSRFFPGFTRRRWTAVSSHTLQTSNISYLPLLQIKFGNRMYSVILRMENGPEFISLIQAEWADKNAVKLELIKP
jgi:hypothetical protein